MKENLMKNFKLFSVLFITITFVNSPTHAVGNDPLAITDLSHGVPFDGISDTELFAIAQEAGVPVLDESGEQNVGAFAGGSAEGQLEEIVEEAGSDIEEEDNDDNTITSDDDEEYKHLKKYKCSKCTKRFRQGNELKSHMRTHTGEHPYKCTTCGRGFTQKCNLNRHMKVHAPVKEKPFKCQICNRGFAEKHQVDEHVWTHNSKKRFKCETCGKWYARKSTLVNHLNSHE